MSIPPEPFARYMFSRPQSPLLQGREPASISGLYVALGGKRATHFMHPYDLAYWRAYVATDLALKSWRAFLPPDEWPFKLPWDVTPAEFHDCVLPYPTGQGRWQNHLVRGPGLPELTAWAAGWPVERHRWNKMLEGATWLLEQPAFILWCKNLAVEILAVPARENVPILRRLEVRERLVANPLSMGPYLRRITLPPWAEDVVQLELRLPRRGQGVGPSKKRALDGKKLPGYSKVGG